MHMKKLTTLACAAAFTMLSGAASAQISGNTVKIGVLTDMSGTYSDLAGAGQGMGIGGNKAQGGAGLQGGAVPRFMQRFARCFAQGRGGRDGLCHPICHQICHQARGRKHALVLREDGLHQGLGAGCGGGAHAPSASAWCQNGVPSTGVLGWAASCWAMAPDWYAARPAHTASANA